MGLKWTEEEDGLLKQVYDESGDAREDFEKFLQALSVKFGRRINGIRGRLAKHYPDIPGWDYNAQKDRDEARKKRGKKKGKKTGKGSRVL